MIKTEFLMRNATWHNFNVILLIVVWIFSSERFKTKVQYWHRNNNTSSILTKQLCLFKITWPKKVIHKKSYSLAMLHLHHTKYLNHAQPRWQAKQLFRTLMFSNFFNFHAIHELEPRHSIICGVEWWLWRRQKVEDSLTSTRRINGLRRCPSIDINMSE